MNTLAIWMPTYHRAHKLAFVADNIKQATMHTYTLYFGIEPEDHAAIEAAQKLGKVILNKHEPGYSGAIQSMYEASEEPFWVHTNDDFLFLNNWDEVPIAMFETPSVKVVGVKQNEADTSYSAICFGRRSYVEEDSGVIDMPNRVFYPYHHNYQDTEFTRTAQTRNVWASCSTPCIIHQHPGILGGEKDETYKKNDATVETDRKTFESRRHLWE